MRELKYAFEFAFVSCQGAMIEAVHLPMAVADPACAEFPPSPSPEDLDAIKRQRLIKALQDSGGNQSEAARRLGTSRTSVWSQIKPFGLRADGTPLQ